MYNSINFNSRLTNLFKDEKSDNYFAHIRNDGYETLSEHTHLV